MHMQIDVTALVSCNSSSFFSQLILAAMRGLEVSKNRHNLFPGWTT